MILLVGDELRLQLDGEEWSSPLLLETIQGEENLLFSDGSYFHATSPIPDEVRQLRQGSFTKLVRWLEQWSWWRLSILAAFLIGFILVARVALNASLDTVTQHFPNEWEKLLGEQSYSLLKKAGFEETGLPIEQRERLLDQARLMAQQADISPDFQILFHNAKFLGPNALAFPGGPIVVTDQLVRLMDNDQQVLAIIAHEFGHIKERHSLRQIIKLIGVTGLATIIFGGNESGLEEVLAVGIDAWALNNSRDYEKEADMFALDLLRKSDIEGSHMVHAMRTLFTHMCDRRLQKDIDKCIEAGSTGWLDSHPGSKERMDYLTEASRP